MRKQLWLVISVCAGVAVAAPITASAHEDKGDDACPSSTPVALHHGGTTTCWSTIQAAVNAASAGDEVVAGPHTYHENVTIPVGKDNITVRSEKGAEDTIIAGDLNGSSTQSVVEIDANSVLLGGLDGRTGFTIENGATAAANPSFDLHGVGVGFDGGTPSGVQVTGNHIEDVAGSVPLPTTPFGRIDGVAAKNSTNVALSANEIGPIRATVPAGSNNVYEYGVIFFNTNAAPAVSSNAVHDLSLSGPCPGTGAFGMAINDSTSGAQVSDNKVSDIAASCRAAGVSSGASGATWSVTDNLIADVSSDASPSQAAGIALKGPGANVTVSGNLLTEDNAGVAVLAPLGSGTHVNENDFIDNPIGVYNAADSSLDATSDYWGCPKGPGADGCDTVVDVGAGHTNYVPFLRHRSTAYDHDSGPRSKG